MLYTVLLISLCSTCYANFTCPWKSKTMRPSIDIGIGTYKEFNNNEILPALFIDIPFFSWNNFDFNAGVVYPQNNNIILPHLSSSFDPYVYLKQPEWLSLKVGCWISLDCWGLRLGIINVPF